MSQLSFFSGLMNGAFAVLVLREFGYQNSLLMDSMLISFMKERFFYCQTVLDVYIDIIKKKDLFALNRLRN